MKLARNSGKNHVKKLFRIYLDEAGRGPLAGPVTVGAILTSKHVSSEMLNDSKLLSENKREQAYAYLVQEQSHGNIYCGSGCIDNVNIDKKGIIRSLRQASCRAVRHALYNYYRHQGRDELQESVYGEDHLARLQLDSLFIKKPSVTSLAAIINIPQTIRTINGLFIDGNHTFGLDKQLPCNVVTIIKGDQKHAGISAASIVAKVERDHCMTHLDKKHPHYGFAKHKGYGTKHHRHMIKKHGISSLHRTSYCSNITTKKNTSGPKTMTQYRFRKSGGLNRTPKKDKKSQLKPKLLLHICCAPDLTRPLHWLKQHFHLCLFRYNPNIHPRAEHSKRYAQFLKLIGLEPGEYDVIEDWYDPKEFFQAMIEQKDTIHESLKSADKKTVLKVAGEMEERSDRCNPCYSMRLSQAAKSAAEHNIPYFTSTLLISPKKHMNKLFQRGVDAEQQNPTTKFLRFDFAKNDGYRKAVELTRKHSLRRQNYCGCGRTINKKDSNYSGG